MIITQNEKGEITEVSLLHPIDGEWQLIQQIKLNTKDAEYWTSSHLEDNPKPLKETNLIK